MSRSQSITIKVHEIATDGLPNMEKLTGKVALIFDGRVVSGWPISHEFLSETLKETGESVWEGDEDVSHGESLLGVTHWLEFPDTIWDLEK